MLIWWYMFALRDVPFLKIEILSQSCLRREKKSQSRLPTAVGFFRFCLHLFLFLFFYSITFRVLTAAAARELFRNIKLLGQFCFGAFFCLVLSDSTFVSSIRDDNNFFVPSRSRSGNKM